MFSTARILVCFLGFLLYYFSDYTGTVRLGSCGTALLVRKHAYAVALEPGQLELDFSEIYRVINSRNGPILSP